MKRFLLPCFVVFCASGFSQAEEPIAIGSRLELLIDNHLIDQLSNARLKMHRPEPQEVVLKTDKPWEGNTCAYYTIFRDGSIYRMYYRGSHYDEKTKKAAHREVTCYAESKDGIRWTKPELNLFEFNGSKKNNIVWDGIGCHNFTPFKDDNPKCTKEARYKALARASRGAKHGLYAFSSPDGIHWTMMSKKPVITQGAFDSQNLAFWDQHAGCYREYHRQFRGHRDIMTGTSKDFIHWTTPKFLNYPGAPKEHLYTNAIRPYFRAPHLLLGFPTRFQPRHQQVEPILMTSRDGKTFHRWSEPLIPITAPKDRDGNRSNYMTWGVVHLPGKDKELSVYATEAYYTGPDSRVRRFTFRTDGFVSLRAKGKQGEMITKPLTFEGKTLRLNLKTARSGMVKVELQDANGKAINGFALEDCQALKGDAIGMEARWKDGADLSSLAGKPIRIRFQLQNADLYSLQFKP